MVNYACKKNQQKTLFDLYSKLIFLNVALYTFVFCTSVYTKTKQKKLRDEENVSFFFVEPY